MSQIAPAPPPGPAEAWLPRPYTQLLRGPRHRWWRPLVSLSVVVGGVAVLFGLLLVVVVVGIGVTELTDGGTLTESEFEDALLTSWWGFLANNLLLAAFIPLSALAVFAGHRWRPRWVSSVEGGLRWRWLLVSGLVPLVALVVLLGGSWLLDPQAFGPGEQRDSLVLLAVVLATTPLQAAGEEYLFRGWLSQAVGSWFARAGLGALVAAAVSATLFAMAHGGQDPWLFADRLCFGLVASYLVWRTGGLETAIAFHALNNVLIFIPTILSGGLEDALNASAAPAGTVVVDLVMFVVIAAVVTRMARRRRLERLFRPPARALAGPSGAAVGPPGHPDGAPAFTGPPGLG